MFAWKENSTVDIERICLIKLSLRHAHIFFYYFIKKYEIIMERQYVNEKKTRC